MTGSMVSSSSSSSSSSRPILKRSSSSGSSSPAPRSAPLFCSNKKVWFDSVSIHYHKIILGDNPAVSDGAPITIGWKSHDQEIVDVDCFEATRPTKPKKRKHSSSLKLPVQDRAAILLHSGYSIQDLAKRIQQVEEIQRQRAISSSESSKWEIFTPIFQRLTRINGSFASSQGNPTKTAPNPAA